MLPIIIVGFLPYQKTEKVVNQHMLDFAYSTIKQLNENMNYHLQEMDLMSRMIHYQLFLTEEEVASVTNQTTESINVDREDFINFLTSLKNNRTFIEDIHVLLNETVYTTALQVDLEVLTAQSWYASALRKLGEKSWFGPHSNDYSDKEPASGEVISLVYPVFSPESGDQKNIIVIIIEMKKEVLDQIFNNPDLRSLGDVFLINEYGRIIYSTDRSLKKTLEKEQEPYITHTHVLDKLKEDNSFISDINFFTGWKLGALIPDEKLKQSFLSIRNLVLTLLIFFLMISILLALTFSNQILKPLQKLQNDIRQVEKGNFYIRSEVVGEDEIASLSRSFNQMVEEIENLISKVAEHERKKKEVEMRLLQYQINPHFLYNTLNSVQWFAKLYQVPNISEMISVLIKLLRASLNSSHLHPLKKELELLSYYVDIQKFRYQENCRVKYNIASGMLQAIVPSFILQPLVENAYFHAFTDGKGTIVIEAFRENDRLTIQVKDNGRGIAEEDIKGIMNSPKNEKHSSGIGLKNVDDKIKLYFGSLYGLSVTSVQNKGTTVTIQLPFTTDKQDVKNVHEP